MYVVKRDGRRETILFDKITSRIEKLCYNLNRNYVHPVEVAKKVIVGMYDGIATTRLDELAAETAASLTALHPDYALLAARIAISNLHKETLKSFSETMRALHCYIDPATGQKAPLLADEVMEVINQNAEQLDSEIGRAHV